MLLCVCIGAFWFLSNAFTSEDVIGEVQAVQWQTGVEIEALGPVRRKDWQAEIPASAEVGDCTNQIRQTVDYQPANGDFNKVCGTPYTKDTGTGIGQVVQDCQYEVLEPYCEYTVQEWQTLRVEQEQGNDFSPLFASPRLESGQRLGAQQTQLVVLFETNQGQYEYKVDSLPEFQQFQIGSQWVLNINGFNQLVGVERR